MLVNEPADNSGPQLSSCHQPLRLYYVRDKPFPVCLDSMSILLEYIRPLNASMSKLRAQELSPAFWSMYDYKAAVASLFCHQGK